MKYLVVLMFIFAAVTVVGAIPVFAQQPGGSSAAQLPQGLLMVTAGFAMAIAAAGCGYAQSRALTAGCEGVSRNPGAADTIRFFIILGLAFIEFLALLTFVVVAILLFTPKFWPVA